MKKVIITLEKAEKEFEVLLNDVPSLIPASYDEVVLEDILDYIPPESRDTVLLESLKLMRYGGTIQILGVDLVDLARRIHYGHESIEQAVSSISGRKNLSHITAVIDELTEVGLTVTLKQLQQNHYIVIGRRDNVE